MAAPLLTDLILLDIIGFSLLSDNDQVRLIEHFTISMRKTLRKMNSRSDMSIGDVVLGYIPTGDGFYLLLNPKMRGMGMLLAVVLKNISDHLCSRLPAFKGVRIAVHSGAITPFSDIQNNSNFVGSGMNVCARMFYAQVDKKDDFYDNGYIVISEQAAEAYNYLIDKPTAFAASIKEIDLGEFREVSFRDKHGIGYEAFLLKNTQKEFFFYFPEKSALEANYLTRRQKREEPVFCV